MVDVDNNLAGTGWLRMQINVCPGTRPSRPIFGSYTSRTPRVVLPHSAIPAVAATAAAPPPTPPPACRRRLACAHH